MPLLESQSEPNIVANMESRSFIMVERVVLIIWPPIFNVIH